MEGKRKEKNIDLFYIVVSPAPCILWYADWFVCVKGAIVLIVVASKKRVFSLGTTLIGLWRAKEKKKI